MYNKTCLEQGLLDQTLMYWSLQALQVLIMGCQTFMKRTLYNEDIAYISAEQAYQHKKARCAGDHEHVKGSHLPP